MADYVKVSDASREIGYAVGHIGRLVREGTVPGKREGFSWLVDMEALREYKERMDAQGTHRHTPRKHLKEEN